MTDHNDNCDMCMEKARLLAQATLYKNLIDEIMSAGNCRNCGWTGCQFESKPGELIRFNCPLWREKEPPESVCDVSAANGG